ncbi:MAG: 3-oxoacyl-ACP reductase family protein [Dehalococcoidia bacterium]
MNLPEFNLEGKVAIVTGASRGIGKAIAVTLAEAGADVVASARSAGDIEKTAEEVRRLGRRGLAIATDVLKKDQIDRMVERTVKELGRVDILVNNAGVALVKPLVPIPGFAPKASNLAPEFFQPTSDEEWHNVLDSNLTSTFLCTRAVAPHMLEQKWGRIINIASVEGLKGVQFHSPYCTSKAAMMGLTRSLALEWARSNITVNAIAPGAFHTDMMAPEFEDERLRQRLLSGIPMRRGGELRELGLLAVYLASEASAYMTGQTISLDGGLTA